MRRWSSARKTKFKGKSFDSRAEAEYYAILLDLKRDGKIKTIERQERFYLPNMKKEMKFHYSVDFVVTDNYGKKHYLEVKGRMMPGNSLRYAYWQYYYDLTLIIVPTSGLKKFHTDWLPK